MRRQGQYGDSGVNPLVASQMQQMSAQRVQHNSAMSRFPGLPDTLPIDDEHKYITSKAEGQWQWDRDGPKGSNPLSSHLYKEGQKVDSRSGLEKKQAKEDPRAQSQEQDMEIGYEENPMAQTFEGLEKKFLDEIMKLTKEQQEAEDAEVSRHREKISEINGQYQEKLMSIRARQISQRDEFLRRESQVRQHQYQQAGLSHYQNSTGPSDPHGYGVSAVSSAGALEEAHRAYAASQFDSYRERSQFLARGRNHGLESRGPYPGGRAYESGARYY
ncbi:ubiquitin carboxyl-terminal hydrolase isoform X2 [Tasmannia lanceolata]|uniref:ubiquitin carboxyl-terminal hydrolase isoform X2 n=1 Tax=Tasmannia lanceolata TaxID=3420 RepID=UPI0040645EFD